jgi:hypothetical protein
MVSFQERNELFLLIESLKPEGRQIPEALLFLRLVVANNPKKTDAEIVQRPDVNQAFEALERWIIDAVKTIKVVNSILPVADNLITKSAEETLETFAEDFHRDRIADWRNDQEKMSQWIARILLRMNWFVDWLRSQVEFLTTNAPYKRWVSRLASNTCKYCRALHGTILPIEKSFAPAARKAGFKRIYGGLYAPPLHPRCQCRLEPYFGLNDTTDK